MNLTAARTILGLKPDDALITHLPECKEARRRIAELAATADNQNSATLYQKGLDEFDEALATVQAHLQATGLAAPPLPTILPQPELAAPRPTAGEPLLPAGPPRRLAFHCAWIFLLLLGASGGAWLYFQNQSQRTHQFQARTALLEQAGSRAVENRDWPAAARAFQEIESSQPGSQIALAGRLSIEAGKNEEQTQFLAYWTGRATAELEAGRLDAATAATRQVLRKYPNHTEIRAIVTRIASQRASHTRNSLIAEARSHLDQHNWQDASASARKILASHPQDAEAAAILADATAALAKAAQNILEAATLFQQARALDHGEFNQQAFDIIREANSLDPANTEISALLKKLSSYTRSLRVPEDFPSLTAAIASARDHDRILLAPGTWDGPISINAAIDLQGTDAMKTIIECAPDEASAITIGPAAKGTRISGVTFRHRTFAVGVDRYSAALVRGGNATFVDCRFIEASGHGLIIIENGQAHVDRCQFIENGWNGIAVEGTGSILEVKDSEAIRNFENGIESWHGATIILTNNRCEANSRNGIHIDNGSSSATLTGNQLIANREFGLVLTSAGSGKISSNIARNNLLGGIVVRAACSNLTVMQNQATANQGSGLIIEQGLPPASFAANSASKNAEPQVLFSSRISNEEPEVPAAEVSVPGQIAEP